MRIKYRLGMNKKEWERKHTIKKNRRLRKWKMLKGCAICGYKEDYRALQIDHIVPINGSHKRKSFNKYGFKKLKEVLSGCQVLCANHHLIKTRIEAEELKYNSKE